MRIWRIWIVAICLLCTSEAHAQRVIYDAGRDTTAQQAVTAAKDITSGSLFDTMLRNVDTQTKVEVDTTMAELREQTRATLTALHFWYQKDVDPPTPPPPNASQAVMARFIHDATECPRTLDCVLRDLRAKYQASLQGPVITQVELDARLKALATKKEQLQAELTRLKAASEAAKEPLVDQAFALLEDHGDDVLAYAQKIARVGANFAPNQFKGTDKALDEIGKGLDQVINLYYMLGSIWQSDAEAARTSVAVDPASLRPPPQQTQLLLLAVDQEHVKAMARIDARMQLEVGAALSHIVTASNELTRATATSTTESIEATLKASTTSIATAREAAASARPPAKVDEAALRETLQMQVLTLHDAAAGVAQMDIAGRLADLRRSDEWRRYSIRRSAVAANTYDVAIQAAVQRLGAYWKRGVKPTDLAQFIFYVTNTFALPAIAIKQE